MDDTPQGATPPATDASAPPAPSGPPAAPDAPLSKECVFCGETIPAFADRCCHCAGFLPLAEGRSASQHFFFLLVCLATFIGTCLPWEGQWFDSNGYRSIHGGFLLLLSGYGVIAFFLNLFHRRMIVWPVILAAVDGSYVAWRRVFQIAGSEAAKSISFQGELAEKKRAFIQFSQLFGPGLWLVTIFCTLFWFVFIVSVIKGGQAAGARKEAEKAARAGRRK